ncbi:dTDP-4-dehydrorhamnose reductase [Mesorhizobium sp. BAC0120]|uniref:dTDP-4-dehydrorhamnose reductase n=1 Tax=Mesorhizobium sp. BAC0120 TaxID=3090670 RepID=UPI00298C03DA|nr:dTDP-4-dehydrorhamnose reductase [Mesorhizobium sp. BAC0120]MDW6021556.1 dTDP-4-dehydrorhamnose reductase [Mesorhizobium sp. BAC0120]
MRIAVTGRKGQLCSALQHLASSQSGIEIVAVGRPDLDLADEPSVRRVLKTVHPDLVVNAAAYTAVDKAEDDREAAQAANALGAGYVAAASAEFGVPILQLSTDYVFDGEMSRPYREEDPTNPLGVYGATKLEGERAVVINPLHAILRTSWVHSPFGPNFVLTMLRLALTRPEIGVISDQIGSPTGALDLADAILRIARKLEGNPRDDRLLGIFHVSSQGWTSWADFASFVFEVSGAEGGPVATVKPISTAEYPTRARRPRDSRLDCGRLRHSYGIELPDWRTGAAETVRRILAGDHLLRT